MGVSTPSGPYDPSEPLAFERDAGQRMGIVMYFHGWADGEFDPAAASRIAVRSAITSRPVMIGETASVEAGGSKSDWISDLFAQVLRRPEIKALVWFHHAKEADWRFRARPVPGTHLTGLRQLDRRSG